MRLGSSRLIQTSHKSDCSVFPAARVTWGVHRDRNRPHELLGRYPALADTSHDVDQHYHRARGILRDAEHDTTIRRMPELGRWTMEEDHYEGGIVVPEMAVVGVIPSASSVAAYGMRCR